MTTIPPTIVRRSVETILLAEDHRSIANDLITSKFLTETIEIFKKVVNEKLENNHINLEWFRAICEDPSNSTDYILAFAGLGKKTITNKRKSTKREIIIEESLESFEILIQTIDELCDSDIEITLSINYNNVSISLNLDESMIVINALAVRRGAIRGGIWSSFGKQIETPLLTCMCNLFNVPEDNYSSGNRENIREIDFYLITDENEEKYCEIKLMGKGNSEGADSTIARDSHVFVASKLSDTNIQQLEINNIEWVELDNREEDDNGNITGLGFMRFGDVLENLKIPHQNIDTYQDIAELVRNAARNLEIEGEDN
ncbi:MAG: CfrBI family restriction endonuclease [Rhodobacteraceae bacterium]|nr:CfrBI family restriction endonuclease [Paracoccaceae bacterium]